jgi:AcrR family transcriptional regulator
MEPTRTRQRHRKPTEVRRAEIAEAALRVMAVQGGRRFTARALANEVGVTDGALFRHFPDMDAIVDAVVERMEAMLFAVAPPAGGDPIERLGVFFRGRVAVLVAHPHVPRLLFSDDLARLCGADRAKQMKGFKRRTRDFIESCLAEAGQNGLLGDRLGPREGALLVQGAVFAFGHLGGGRADVLEMTASVWSALESLLRGTDREPGCRRKASRLRPTPGGPDALASSAARRHRGDRGAVPPAGEAGGVNDLARTPV